MNSCTDNGARDVPCNRNAATGSQNTVDLLVGISPELRTPLSAIIALVHVLRAGPSADRNHALVDACLGDIDDCAAHLAGLIDEILSVARAEQPAATVGCSR